MTMEIGDPAMECSAQTTPETQAAPYVVKPRLPLLLPALASGLLLWGAFFPLNAGWLGWLGLVPLLILVRSPARAWRVYPAAWMCGVIFFFTALSWLRFADDRPLFEGDGLHLQMGCCNWFSLAFYCSLFFPVTIWLLRRLDRRTRLPLIVTLPAVWVALEFIRALNMTGFPWYFLAHTQHEILPIVQVSDLAGAAAVSFVVAAVNAVLFELLFSREWFRSMWSLPERPCCCSMRLQALSVAGLVSATLIYGLCRLAQEDFREGPRVALVQGNLAQNVRNQPSNDANGESAFVTTRDHFARLTNDAIKLNPDLIVWPETSLAGEWGEITRGQPDEYSMVRARDAVEHWPTALLLGTNGNEGAAEPRTRYNSAVLLGPGAECYRGRYDKVHRVPFGEFVPLLDTFAFMKAFAPYDFEYSIRPGPELTRFHLGEYRFGVLICFEDTDVFLARQYVASRPALFDRLTDFVSGAMYRHLPPPDASAPSVDFLVNVSNDAWFDGSSEHDEHLAICRFRAIECRRSVARSVNMGISAVIDGSGRVVAIPGSNWEKSKKIDGVLLATIPLDNRMSLYALLGDWLPALCLLVIALGLVGSCRRQAN